MIFSIGHSNHSFERFLELLRSAKIEGVADVRSAPMSRWAPQFNKEALADALKAHGLSYVYLGRELGGRPKDTSLMTKGKPDYAKMARAPAFAEGIVRLLEEAKGTRVAMMCAERDPVDCHRFLLIARHLAAQGVEVTHILSDGYVESQADTEARAASAIRQGELFA